MEAPPNEPGRSGEDALAPPPPAEPPARPRKSGLAFFVVLLLLFAALGTLAQAANAVLGLAWSETFALLLPAVIVATGSNLVASRSLMLARRPSAAALGFAALVGTVGFFAAGSLMALTSLVMPERWLELFDVAKMFERPALQRVALGIIAATLAPFCEEVAFRGWLLTALRTRHRAGTAIALSGLLFALMHLDPVRFVALLALGTLYAWLAWRAGSVWPSIVAHAINNGLGAVLATLQPEQATLRSGHERPLQLVFASALTLSITAAALQFAAGAYRRATPAPPPLDDALTLRNPAEPSTEFALRRVPRPLLATIALAVAALAALLLSAHRPR